MTNYTKLKQNRQKTGGRKRGTPNKTTVAVKDAILQAFDSVGGEQYLVQVAENDPKTFCTLLARVLPSEIAVNVTSDLESKLEAALEYSSKARQASHVH